LGNPSSGAIDGIPDRMVKVSVTEWVFKKAWKNILNECLVLLPRNTDWNWESVAFSVSTGQYTEKKLFLRITKLNLRHFLISIDFLAVKVSHFNQP
jgi:hypothetical protein